MRSFAAVPTLLFGLGLPDPTWACSLAVDPAFANFRPQSNEAPPPVQIGDIVVDLGSGYGAPGPGDCSDLGSVKIQLTTTDTTPLDDRFGARLTLISGSLPVVFVDDLASKDFPIRDNRVGFTVKDNQSSSLVFSVQVQLVNAAGDLGPTSPPMTVEEGGGCTATKARSDRSSAWLGLGALLMIGLRPSGRRARPERRG